MTSDNSLQFREPAADPAQHSTSTTAPPMERHSSSLGKVAAVAKHLVKSPGEEKEHLSLQKTVREEAGKGEVDVGVLEA